MSNRTFYRKCITLEVLSETPIDFDDNELIGAYRETIYGDCSGQTTSTEWEPIDAATMARLLTEQGSDPEFFCLTPEGKDLEEEDENT